MTCSWTLLDKGKTIADTGRTKTAPSRASTWASGEGEIDSVVESGAMTMAERGRAPEDETTTNIITSTTNHFEAPLEGLLRDKAQLHQLLRTYFGTVHCESAY